MSAAGPAPAANAMAPSFVRLTRVVVAAAATVAVAGGGWASGQFAVAVGHTEFWVLVALTCLTELLPIRLPRKQSVDLVTVSSAFALSILFLFGAAPAIVVWSLASLIADASGRLGSTKAIFNAAQYVLCMAAAAVALGAAGGQIPLGLTVTDLPAMAAASGAFFVVNHVLAGAGVALLSGVRVLPFLGRDLGFLSWTAGFQLGLAPLLIGARGPLSVIGALPVMAIYLGGRQAAGAAHRAAHDGLTGLPNRSLLEERLADALAQGRRTGAQVWVMLVDLDQFKAVNDTFGHASGDDLLVGVARRMQAAVGPADTLARLGGDEFAVLLAGYEDEPSAQAAAQRLLAGLAEPIALQGMALQAQASVGLAGAGAGTGAGDLDGAELLRRADEALYVAKRHRGSVATSAGQAGRGPGLDRTALARALSEALDNGDVTACFQPKVGLVPGVDPAVEALARWRHPDLGMIDPSAFVAVAEQTGMIARLTARILDLALVRCAESRRQGIALGVAVNLSPKSLVDRSLPGMVGEALARHGVPGNALQLEITESACVADLPASPVLEELRALGVTFAIDDFGTGYSSLAQLAELPVEEIKIDRSFVLDMADNPQAEAIVRSIVSLACSLELRVTAEGVETASTLARLRSFGCHYAQGYLFGQPSPNPRLSVLRDGHIALAA